MKATFFASVAALFAISLAAPTYHTRQITPTFTLQLANDMSGATDSKPVTVDAGPIALGGLFTPSALTRNGRLIATSAMNTSPGQPVSCMIMDLAHGTAAQLDQQDTFADLDGNPNMAIETDVTDFVIECVSL